jgi:hypothetical protein
MERCGNAIQWKKRFSKKACGLASIRNERLPRAA